MLFEAKGWNLKNEKSIALGGVENKKKKSKKAKKREVEVPKKREVEVPKKREVEVSKKREVEVINDGEQGPKDKDKRKNKNSTTETDPIDKKETLLGSEHKNKKRKKLLNDHDDSSDTTKRAKSIQKENMSTTPGSSSELVSRTPQTKLTPLQQKMMSKLSGSRFRWINEQLYTTTSEEALRLIREQPGLFDEYHQGFRSQVSSWPENPVDVFVEQFKQRLLTRNINAPGGLPGTRDKRIVIADMGCGEAQFALDVNTFVKQEKQRLKKLKHLDVKVHSFDLKKHNDRITVADIKNVPIPDESVTIVIFCLALMGTNFLDFIKEAYRILQPRGELWIAEIKSRFSDVKNGQSDDQIGKEFVETLKLCGFYHKSTDNSNKMFIRFEFFKPSQDIINERKIKVEKQQRKFINEETQEEKLQYRRRKQPEGEWLLKPCIYKRR
ncbi:RRP8 [Candida oxycetoniae]|uniref:Ribosomal RNA-processing protein 8 n=1 Tax=Candida oxycetoniae TaxID=497107 RepID=A0AAI9WXZ6_9ASCO|nr:RRP8 [Candida oxycetoniae]KAI3404515.2 RRP8 [Candida oxycetoniae]